MSRHRTARMRRYWDARAQSNAAWYVDTSLAWDEPDMQRFFAAGDQIVQDNYLDGLARPAQQCLAVEIGSGLGRVCRSLAAHFDRVIGVDVSPQMVERARRLVPDPSIEFLVGSGADLGGVATTSADLVFTFTVFQHIPSPAVVDGYIVEAGRVLRPGGVFVFQWNNEPGSLRWRVRRLALSTLQRTRLRPEPRARNAPEFLGSRISRRWIERSLSRAGLRLVGTRGDGTLFAFGWAVREDAGRG